MNFDFNTVILSMSRKNGTKKTNFNTKIDIENNKLKYKLTRDSENRKCNSFTEGEQEIYIDDIISVKNKMGFSFSFNFFDIVAFLGIILLIGIFILKQIVFGRRIFAEVAVGLIFIIILFAWYFTCKCIEIKYNTNDGIKKLVFPISRTCFLKTPNSAQKQVDELKKEIKR